MGKTVGSIAPSRKRSGREIVMEDQNLLARKIQNLRKEKNLTQREVADKLGVSEQAVSKWETGGSHS